MTKQGKTLAKDDTEKLTHIISDSMLPEDTHAIHTELRKAQKRVQATELKYSDLTDKLQKLQVWFSNLLLFIILVMLRKIFIRAHTKERGRYLGNR